MTTKRKFNSSNCNTAARAKLSHSIRWQELMLLLFEWQDCSLYMAFVHCCKRFTWHLRHLFGFFNILHDHLFFLCGPLVPMGIIKIRHQGPGKDNDPLHSSLTPDDEFVEEERLIQAKDHSHELNDLKLSDTGCEYALINDQTCNVPFELYELPNLNELLSLETWNSALTEKERFYLAAYLPDMDQETFVQTMLELLGGANILFGSPLEIFFHRLKGGFYSLQVSHYREGLKFFYERQYYHSLRSYHERMGQKIEDMRKAWSNCKPNASVEERVQILNDKKNRKPVVDLNAFPTDEELSFKAERMVIGLPHEKKPRYVNEEISTYVPTVDLNGMAFNSRTKAKGVLKIKPLEMNMTSKQIGLQLHRDCRVPLRRSPKGVLKIKPKGYFSSAVERPIVISVFPDQSSNNVFDVYSNKLSPSRFASHWHEKNLNRKLIPELTNCRQNEDALNIGSGLFDSVHSFQKKKKINSMKMYSNDTRNFGKFIDSQQSRVLCTSSLGLYQSNPANCRRKIMQTDATKAVSRNSTSVMDDYQSFLNYPDQSERRNGSKIDEEGVERSHIFPITYKRKKSSTKFSAVKNLKQYYGTSS